LVKDEYFKPVGNAYVSVQVTLPDGKKEQVDVSPEAESGEYGTSFALDSPGEYNINARAFDKKRFLGSDRNNFVVLDVSRESGDTAVNEQFVREISEKTGGQFFTADNFKADGLNIKSRMTKSDVLYEINIWNKTPVYLILIILFAAEWYLRRKSGLL
jgi:hypothetical protein